MYEEYREKLEGELGPQVHQWSDQEIVRTMTIRNPDPSKCEDYRKELEGEFGRQVYTWSDQQITRIMTIRNSPAYKKTVAQQNEAERDRQVAEDATQARIKARLQEGATEAAEELEGRRAAMLDAWLQGGGTAGEFEGEWPSIRTEILRDRAMRREDERERSARVAAREVF